MLELVKTSDDSSVSSVDPDTDGDPYESLFGTNCDNASMASNWSNTHIEDVTITMKDTKILKAINLVLCKDYPISQFAINLPIF